MATKLTNAMSRKLVAQLEKGLITEIEFWQEVREICNGK